MRVALLPDDYLPNSTRVHAKMFHELANEFTRRGHHPVIITPGTPDQERLLIVDFHEGIEVWRFKSGKTREVGKIARAINESLLSIRAWLAIRKEVARNPFDICINYSPTIFFGLLASKLKKRGAFVYLILRDLFPQWIIDEGLIKENSIIARYFRYFEQFNYRVSDCIGLMSDANLSLFRSINPQYQSVEVLMNWTDTHPMPVDSIVSDWRSQWGLSGKVVFFYGGNIGHAQDMANLMRLARNMGKYDGAHFLFVGQGDEVQLITALKEEWSLDNVTIKPSVDQHVYREILTQVDVGLFSLSAKHTAHNFPGKLLGYMVESLPILGSVNAGNDVIDCINNGNAGFVYTNGNDEALFQAAESLYLDGFLRRQLGENSRSLLEKFFSVESAVDKVLQSYDVIAR